jgi:hypothetical protein
MPFSRCRPFAFFGAALAILCSLSCASERKPINKVQANALSKAFFVGDPGDPKDDPEFFWRNYVVDGSEGQELVGIGSWSGVDRVKWEVTENMLFARRAYGQNDGADDKGIDSSRIANGTIVAAYPISSHFDIKRAYNPQTGEELNVVEENVSDRPWYQRDYFRVDWSVNQVDSPLWTDMFIGKLTGELKVTPVSYYVSDPNNDNAPHFDAEGGYFDVTSKFTVEPAGSMYSGIPQCVLMGFFTGNAIDNCDAQEAIVRSSYLRVDQVDPDNDFEPFDNPKAPQDVFGNPGGSGDSLGVGITTPPRIAYDPAYGYTDSGVRRFYNLHNIWKKSHQTYGSCSTDVDCQTKTGKSTSICLPSGSCTLPCNYDARADGNGNGTEDQCENRRTGYTGSNGAQCSVRNRCTIPYRDRETKPVAWWVNPEMPDTLQDEFDGSGKKVATGATEDTIYTWNQAVKLAVAHAREVECRRTGGARDACHGEFFVAGETEMLSFGAWGIEKVKPMDDMVITCHNPVRDYDSTECGKAGTTARVGDIRHHFLFYWPYSSRAPWGGIANWNGDPLSGMMIGAAAQVMGRSATYGAAQVRDVLMVANNELDMTAITNGTPAQLYQDRLRFGQKRTALSAAEMERRIAGIDVAAAAAAVGPVLDGATPAARMKQLLDIKTHTTADPQYLASAITGLTAAAKNILGSKIETDLMTPGWMVDAANMSPSAPIDDSALNAASPLRGRDPARLNLAMSTALTEMGKRGVCTFALGGDSVGNPDVRGVARYFGDVATGIYGDDALIAQDSSLKDADLQTLSNRRAELIYDHLTKETYKGILLHEVGHGMGMFHNFASSYDATNFNPQYWQLRTNEGASSASCKAKSRADGSSDTCMGPRFLDPETDDELGQADESRPGINYFGHTSTMEYQNERFFENVGLGQYDVMTMGALYGRVLQTFDADAADGVAAADQPNYGYLNYTQLTEDNLVIWTPPLASEGVQPMHYTELARRIKVFDPARCRPATDDEKARGEWRIVHGVVCSPPPKDYAHWDDFIDDTGPRSVVAASAPAGAGNVRWPYRFGQTNNAYIHINPSDAGADPYEVTMETIRKFDYQYPFLYFRRQRRDFDYDALPSITGSRFFDRLRSYHWVTARNTASLPSVSAGNLEEFKRTDDVVRSNLLAESAMLDGIVRAILVPQVGTFGTASKKYVLGTSRRFFDVTTSQSTSFSLDASTARFVDPDFDTGASAGGSWEYLNWITHAGFDVEKSNATMALTDGRPTLVSISRDTYLDGRNVFVNFRTDMAKGVDRLLGGLLSADWDAIAPSLRPAAVEPEYLTFTDDKPTRASSATARLLYPNFGYKQQLGAMLWAQLFSSLGTDLSLVNKTLVYLEGTENVIDFPDDQKVKFTDPRSGITYVARLFGPDEVDGKTIDSGIASRMIAHANDLLAQAYDVEKDADDKPVTDAFGRPNAVLDSAGQLTPTGDATIVTGFSDYVGFLDSSVEISKLVGRGPFTGAN